MAPRVRTGRRSCRSAGGSLSLEAAMVLPLMALCAVVLLHLVGVARDALLAQELARLGARVAATDPSDHAVRTAVVAGADRGVHVDVMITPTQRRHGQQVTVEVTVRRPESMFDVPVVGRAVARGEPVLGGGDAP